MAECKIVTFEQFSSDENFRLAWKRLTHSMRWEVKDRLGLQAYAPQIDIHIQILQRLLNAGYSPDTGYPFFKSKQDRSLRRFSFLTMDDRFVYQAICNALIANSYSEIHALSEAQRLFSNIPTPPKAESPFTFRRTFTSKFGRHEGQYDRYRSRVLRSFREFKQNHKDGWLVRTDVRSYFPSIRHSCLLSMLVRREWLPEKRTRNILKRCLSKWQIETGKGIPIGYECSDHIGNIFLFPVDEALSDFKSHRYVDDIYIFVEDFERAKQAIHLVDMELSKLSLQRNTLKTEFLSLQDLSEEELRRKLTESLSQLAQEQPTEETENERQQKLLDLLRAEFGNGFERLNLRQGIRNISRVAFVLYRLRDPEEHARQLAYFIVDHHPDYALHAMAYLFRAYRDDPMLQPKLTKMFGAEYEANDVKGHALKYLALLDEGGESASLLQHLLDGRKCDDWHLRYMAMRDIVDRFNARWHSISLGNGFQEPNPIVRAFAANVLFERADSRERANLVNIVIESDSNYAKKIGLYLAYRYRVKVDPELVPSALHNLVDEERIKEKADFHVAIKELFHIPLATDFPIKNYFGDVSDANQLLSDIQLFRAQGIKSFLDTLNCLLGTFFGNWSRLYDSQAYELRGGYPDDDDLTKLRMSIEANFDGSYNWSDGKQDYLLGEARKVVPRYLRKVHAKENMIMREEVFICYARSDSYWKCRVRTHLKPFQNYFGISVWSDDQITKGGDWDQEIKEALQRAKVAILLETPDFLASNYIHNEELPEIMRADAEEGLRIMRFPIRSSSVEITPLATLNAVWDTSVLLQALEDEHRTDKVDQILAQACKEVACIVSERFWQLHCNDDP